MAKSKNECFLTELILSIQNEVQSAVDYIDDISKERGTELGESSAVMQIENLRLKVPFVVDLEQKKTKIEEEKVLLKDKVLDRKGFLLNDVRQKGGYGIYSKLKVLNVNPKEANSDKQIGEMEIVFSPIRRE